MTAFEKPQLVLRLFVMLVALIVSVQPFADEVRNDTSCDRDQEPKNDQHDRPPFGSIGESNRKIITYMINITSLHFKINNMIE